MSPSKQTEHVRPYGANAMMFYDRSVERAIAPLAEMGYDVVEIWIEHLWREDEEPARVARALRQHGVGCTVHCPIMDVNLTSVNRGMREEALRQNLQAIELAHSLEAALVVIHPGHLSSSRDNPETHWQLELRAFEQLLEYGDRYGVRLAVENMDTPAKLEVVKTCQDIRRIVDHFPPGKLGVVLDTTHLSNTENILAFIAGVDEISHVHLSDAEVMPSGAVRTHLPFGEGKLDWQRIFQALLPRCPGILSLETFIPAGKDVPKVLAQREFLDRMLGRREA